MKKIKHYYQSVEGWFNMENQYLELLNHTPEKGIFVELGCFKGKSTSFIGVEIHNQKRDINFYAVDSFGGATNSNDANEIKAYQEININSMMEEYLQNTSKVKDYITTIFRLSHEAANQFSDNLVDAIFIDAGHSFEAVKKDIEAWLPKMKPNGIIAGHDYWAWEGVNKAVNEKFGKPHKVENDCWFIYLDRL
jgi:predicted O-methyltransferase YrrM